MNKKLLWTLYFSFSLIQFEQQVGFFAKMYDFYFLLLKAFFFFHFLHSLKALNASIYIIYLYIYILNNYIYSVIRTIIIAIIIIIIIIIIYIFFFLSQFLFCSKKLIFETSKKKNLIQ